MNSFKKRKNIVRDQYCLVVSHRNPQFLHPKSEIPGREGLAPPPWTSDVWWQPPRGIPIAAIRQMENPWESHEKTHWNPPIPWKKTSWSTVFSTKLGCQSPNLHWLITIFPRIPVVPHRAVAEVSKIGHCRRGELLWCMDGRAIPLMDGKVVVVTSPTTAGSVL